MTAQQAGLRIREQAGKELIDSSSVAGCVQPETPITLKKHILRQLLHFLPKPLQYARLGDVHPIDRLA
jgi:hypothetical protein